MKGKELTFDEFFPASSQVAAYFPIVHLTY